MQAMLLHRVIRIIFKDLKIEENFVKIPFLQLDMEEVLNVSLVSFKDITESMSFQV